MKRILAIDPGNTTGFAYLGETGRTSGTWKIEAKRDESRGMRLLKLEAKLVEIAKLGIDLLVFEVASRGSRHPNAIESLAELQAIIKRFAESREIVSRGYSPKEIKTFICGKGNASKDDVIAAVKKRYGVETTDNNEADAIALLELARHMYDFDDSEVPF